MKTTLLQTDITWADPDANMKRNEERLALLPETDLVVLPEMFSTGFVTDPAGIAEADCRSLEWMRKMAGKYGFAIAGSVSTEEKGKLFNRFYFVEPEGKVTCYDKRHLFSYSGEDKKYTPGNQRVILEYNGLRILPQICYDLRFPETSRNLSDTPGEPAFDLIIYVASWPVRRIDAWSALLKARAIENQCFVIGVNRVGSDPSCNYSGASALLDPLGRTIAEGVPDRESIVTAEIDTAFLESCRASFPVLKDII